jgi:hypothetical protein
MICRHISTLPSTLEASRASTGLVPFHLRHLADYDIEHVLGHRLPGDRGGSAGHQQRKARAGNAMASRLHRHHVILRTPVPAEPCLTPGL